MTVVSPVKTGHDCGQSSEDSHGCGEYSEDSHGCGEYSEEDLSVHFHAFWRCILKQLITFHLL